MSETEENQQIQENTSESLGKEQEDGNEEVKKDEIPKPSKRKPAAINKDGTPRKIISDEAQKARLEVLRAGRQKANIKRQLAKEEANKKKEYNPPAIVEQAPVKSVKVIKPKKKKTIVIEESESEEEEQEEVVVVKRVRKPKPKQEQPPSLPMHPPPPRPPPRQESEADKKKKLMQLREDLTNKKIYKSLFG
tara:strand:- start:567 stop:1142 length:576 start_codon:yes stop_codon:yes gene_type:complete